MLANKNLNSVRSKTHEEYGIEARRTQFTKDSYRQPVLTQKAMVPRSYRLGQVDPLTEECRTRLKELQEYSLMHDRETGSSESDVQSSTRGECNGSLA
jgi:hypothetical protein